MADLASLLPFARTPTTLGDGPVGVVVVDPGVAFTREGALADPERMLPMVRTIDKTLRRLRREREDLHVLVFLDTHHADIPEPPYPPHGNIGTGEEEIDPELAWLLDTATVIRKDCINGFVGAIDRQTGHNAFTAWVIDNEISELVVMGDCTDICVSDFVVTALSARNHGLLTAVSPDDREAYVSAIVGMRISVLADACATFHAPGHDHLVAHHVGLWLMASRGAEIASEVVSPAPQA